MIGVYATNIGEYATSLNQHTEKDEPFFGLLLYAMVEMLQVVTWHSMRLP